MFAAHNVLLTIPTVAGRANLNYTYSANTENASLNVTSINGYVAGSSDITITVNSGIYIWSSSISTPALTLTGGTTGDTVKIVNNGYIMGKGGAGAYGTATAESGGTAISLGFNTTIDNTDANAYIGGGGGGGAGGNFLSGKYGDATGGGGGGAGGGAGGLRNGVAAVSGVGGGGAGGSIGQIGNAGAFSSSGQGGGAGGGGGIVCQSSQDPASTTMDGGGGGRIFPGTGGAGGKWDDVSETILGGTGGSSNNNGNNGVSGISADGGGCGGGGGWGASGGSAVSGTNTTVGAAGSGGKAVALNGKTVTWVSSNTTRVYGAVS